MNYFRYLRLRLFETGLMPTSKVARTAWYLLGLDLLLLALQKLLGLFKLSYGESLTGWVFFLSFGVIVLFGVTMIVWPPFAVFVDRFAFSYLRDLLQLLHGLVF